MLIDFAEDAKELVAFQATVNAIIKGLSATDTNTAVLYQAAQVPKRLDAALKVV